MKQSLKIPICSKNNYSREIVQKRIRFLETITGVKLDNISDYSIEPELTRGKIEDLIGFSQVPIGIVGPLKINSQYAAGEYVIPLATLEGALISSYNRGARIISLSGGANVVSVHDGIQRAPYFVLDNVFQANTFIRWFQEQFPIIKTIAEATTKYGKLIDYKPFLIGNTVYIRLEFTTGDAMGMNMITKASAAVCEYVKSHFPIQRYVIESNMAVDKKASYLNMILGRGKSVTAEIAIPRKIVSRFLGTTPEIIASAYQRQMVGNTIAGVMGSTYHFANGLAAIFLACGQDLGNITESSVGVVHMEARTDALYISIYLPSIIVGTVGGGTSLPTQKECLKLIGCYGENKARKLAEIIAGTLLAGEISLAGSIAAQDFVEAHEKYGRNRPNK